MTLAADDRADLVPDAGDPFAARRRRLLEVAATLGCSAAVLYSPARFSLLDIDPLWWSTGLRALDESAAIVGPGAQLNVFVSPPWDLERAAEHTGGRARPAGESLFESLARCLRELDVAPEELLFCGEARLSARSDEEARRSIGAGWQSGDRPLSELARRRDPHEIALAEEATTIALEGYRLFLGELRTGLAEYEAVALLDAHLRSLGSDDNFVLVSASRRNRSVHPPTDRTIERGDVLLAEISPSRAGVFTQICRTVTLGPPEARVCDDYDMLAASLDAGLAACVPGSPVGEVVAAMDAVIGAAGFSDYCRPPYMRARGHGLGIGSVLPGDITSASEEYLAEGDLFVLHPNQYLPTSGYLLCGEPIVIAPGRPRLLSGSAAGIDRVEV